MRPGSLFAVLLVMLAGPPAFAQSKLEFNRDIRPILADNCFACHGPDPGQRKGDLRLAEATEPAEGHDVIFLEEFTQIIQVRLAARKEAVL